MESVIRISLIFVFITIALRILGKRELGEMSPYELVMLLLIPEIVSQALTRDDSSITNGLIGISTLLTLVLFNSFLSYRFSKYRDVVEGKPVILFHHDKFVEGALDRERVSVDEILSEIRTMGYEHFNQIKWVVLEPDGKISCIPKDLDREGSFKKPSQS